MCIRAWDKQRSRRVRRTWKDGSAEGVRPVPGDITFVHTSKHNHLPTIADHAMRT